jgi:trk/ktr system potassium uptake protein
MPGAKSLAALTYAARPRVVLKYVGQLAVAVAVLTLVPVAAGVVLGDFVVALYFAGIAAALGILGGLFARLPRPADIQDNEALVITALAYLLATVALAVPFAVCGVPIEDALFESVSGVTTKGLSTLASVASLPRTLIFARAWMQYFGGLGIVVLSLALLVRRDFVARRLVEPAAGEPLATTTRAFALRVSGVDLGLGVAGIALLAAVGLAPFDAIALALAGVSTGGYAPSVGSIAGLGRGQQSAVVLLGFLGAISLPLYRRAAAGDWRRALTDPELLALVAALAVVSGVLILLGAVAGGPVGVIDRALLAVSAQTTTGFAPVDVGGLDPASKLVLMLSMAIGGSVGSTAGGIKLLRLLMVLAVLRLLFRRLALTRHAVADLQIAGRPVELSEAVAALALILMFVGTALASWLPFLAAGYPPLDALFEVVSALGTVGLSTGVTSAELPRALKAVLCVDMLLGRVELVAMLMLLYPPVWFGRRTSLT